MREEKKKKKWKSAYRYMLDENHNITAYKLFTLVLSS